jgi:[ribosomal protein S5]-alanine N-acetyltransferase
MNGDEGVSRVILRELTAVDEEEFIGLARASVGLHHPWYTLPTTPEAFQAYLTRLSRSSTEGRLVCVRNSGAMVGIIIIDSIIRGRFQSATLSYAAFAPAAGRGYMTEGLSLVLRYAFDELRLHRLEANIQPANRASLALVRRQGFRKGGLLARHAVHRRRVAGPRAMGHHSRDERLPARARAPHPARPLTPGAACGRGRGGALSRRRRCLGPGRRRYRR